MKIAENFAWSTIVGEYVPCLHDYGECDPVTCNREIAAFANVELIFDGRLKIEITDRREVDDKEIKRAFLVDGGAEFYAFCRAVLAARGA